MSVTKLKAHRDGVVKAGIGTYLDVVKGLIAAIDEHVAEDGTQTASDTTLQAKATELEQEVVKLRAQVATLTQAAEEAIHQAIKEEEKPATETTSK